jgi:hypothetical protein
MRKTIAEYLLKKTLFRPVKLPEQYAFAFDAPFEEIWLETPDGQRLNALYFKCDVIQTQRRGVVLYFHGNRDHLQRWGAFHAEFNRLGYDFFIPDYRGYGKSTGEPDEQLMFEDARMLYQWVRERYAPEEIILYGRSLGSAFASYLAANHPARLLILETPFNNIKGLLSSHLPRFDLTFEPALKFPNHEHLERSSIPMLIFHGTRDRVVPYSSAATLKTYLKKGDAFITIEGGSHNNLSSFPEYRQYLEEWLKASSSQ